DARRDLFGHLEPLSDHRWRKISEAGCAAARSRDARHKVAAHWIGHANEHDWDSSRLVQQRGGRGGRIANQYVGLQGDQLLSEDLRLIRACRREAVIDQHAPALLPAVSLKCLPECHEPRLYLGVIFGVADEHPDPTGRLLRARRERPCDGTAEEGDELATLHRCNHSITSSASASNLSGTSRPSAFAVLRLMIISNLV